ncbi:MAG: hypothetical protein WAT46_08985 [Saprospiraceae bacterium]
MQNYILHTLLISFFSLVSSVSIGQTKKSIPPKKTTNEKIKSISKPDFNIIRDTVCSSWTLIFKANKIEYDNFVCDRLGNIFFIKKENRIDSQKVYRIVNNKIVDVHPCANGAYELGVDQNHEVVLQTWPYDNKRYYKYSNSGWYEMKDLDSIKMMKRGYQTDWWKEKVSLPRLSNKLASYHIVKYPSNLHLAISGDDNNPQKSNVYLYKNGVWQKYFDFFNGLENISSRYYEDNIDEVIVQGKSIYFLDTREGEIWMNDGNVIIKSVSERKEYINKPVKIICSENDKKVAENLINNNIGIYERGGKIGLRAKDGTILTRPLFDKITFEKSPNAEIEDYAEQFLYRLTVSEMNFYYSSYSPVDTNYLCGYNVSKTVCPKCKGAEEINVKTEQFVTKKVPATYLEYTSTNHYNGNVYKISKQITKEHEEIVGTKITTKKVKCDQCNGNSIKITRQDAIYDEQKMKYVTKTITIDW